MATINRVIAWLKSVFCEEDITKYARPACFDCFLPGTLCRDCKAPLGDGME